MHPQRAPLFQVAGDLVRRLHLEAHVDQPVATYSGGTRRKLSVALALLGHPDLLLLVSGGDAVMHFQTSCFSPERAPREETRVRSAGSPARPRVQPAVSLGFHRKREFMLRYSLPCVKLKME